MMSTTAVGHNEHSAHNHSGSTANSSLKHPRLTRKMSETTKNHGSAIDFSGAIAEDYDTF